MSTLLLLRSYTYYFYKKMLKITLKATRKRLNAEDTENYVAFNELDVSSDERWKRREMDKEGKR